MGLQRTYRRFWPSDFKSARPQDSSSYVQVAVRIVFITRGKNFPNILILLAWPWRSGRFAIMSQQMFQCVLCCRKIVFLNSPLQNMETRADQRSVKKLIFAQGGENVPSFAEFVVGQDLTEALQQAAPALRLLCALPLLGNKAGGCNTLAVPTTAVRATYTPDAHPGGP